MLPFLKIKESVVSAFDNIRELSLFLSKSDSEKIEAVSSILKRTSFKRITDEDVTKIAIVSRVDAFASTLVIFIFL
jgi:hypothetical protein